MQRLNTHITVCRYEHMFASSKMGMYDLVGFIFVIRMLEVTFWCHFFLTQVLFECRLRKTDWEGSVDHTKKRQHEMEPHHLRFPLSRDKDMSQTWVKELSALATYLRSTVDASFVS